MRVRHRFQRCGRSRDARYRPERASARFDDIAGDFRAVDGFAERVVYREYFPRGLTALDDVEESTLGLRSNVSHFTARDEVKALIDALKLPMDERGKRRAAARAEWAASADKPLDTHGLLVEEGDRPSSVGQM